jgi:hypothetical protein
MNVLILTPDRVGSTLLQRLLTIYMQLHQFDKPVINLHELTNGLIEYYNPVFNRTVLGKPSDGKTWGYYQTLPEVVKLLDGADHYKTSRLARYHIRNREDNLSDQLGFYHYLNDNFFVISARRENLLEHALSWCIYTHSKRLNVYAHAEKVNVFLDLYQNQITADPTVLVKYLDQYVEYIDWCDRHFSVGSVFNYEQDLPNIEKYILNLPVFNNQPKLTWEDSFGQKFQDWNMCHYLGSDLSGLSTQIGHTPQLQLEHSLMESVQQHQLQVHTQDQIANSMSLADQKFLMAQGPQYKKTADIIDELVKNKVLVTGVPIKLQTMLEKRLLVRNFDQCVDVYNQWVAKNGIGTLYTDEQLAVSMTREIKTWHAQPELTYTSAD